MAAEGGGRRRSRRLGAVAYAALALAVMAVGMVACSDAPEPAEPETPRGPQAAAREWLDAEDHPIHDFVTQQRTGDMEQMRRHGVIRVLVSYSNTNYFITDGQQRGLEFELLRAYGKFLAGKEKQAGRRPPRLVFLPLPFDRLIPALLAGEGDVVASGLTITNERNRVVRFTRPYRSDVHEVVVRGAHAEPVPQLSDLSGRNVHVVRGSSWAGHLREHVQGGSFDTPPRIVEVDETLEAEDLMQMVAAGIYDYTVVDDHLAELWAEVLPRLVVERGARVYEEGRLAWAVRPDSPELAASLDAFVASHRQGTLHGNILFKRYFADSRWVSDPTRVDEWEKLAPYEAAFRRYGERYGFHWLQLVALAYQESRLDPRARSRHGAVGLMQIKPSTARDPNVGIRGVAQDPDANIHAGTRYLAYLRDRYFSDPAIPAMDRVDFTLAAYNAGPARVAGLRKRARQQGLDPDRWFDHVEHLALAEIGRETVEYVANVNRYFVAYRWLLQLQHERERAREGAG